MLLRDGVIAASLSTGARENSARFFTMTSDDKQADRHTATGLTMQERAQKNRLDANLDARVAEIVEEKKMDCDLK